MEFPPPPPLPYGIPPGPPPLPVGWPPTMDDRVSSAVLGLQEREVAAVVERSRCGAPPTHNNSRHVSLGRALGCRHQHSHVEVRASKPLGRVQQREAPR
jgi:hypothetical protein